jgi:hypothetical protein
MARFILLLIALFIGIIFALTFVLGVVRRLFGVFTPTQAIPTNHASQTNKRSERSAEVLYANNNVTVLRGESLAAGREHDIRDENTEEERLQS